MQENSLEPKKRCYSLDLLRIISMIMIIFLHMGSHGGIIEKTMVNGWFYCAELTIQTLCIVSVDVFVLISGYFLVDQKFRLSKLVRIVVEVWFYSWIILILFHFLGLEIVDIKSSILPLSFSQNWFATAYVGLYLVFPILNKVIDNTSEGQLRIIIIVLFVVLGLWCDIVPSANPFGSNPGASTVWFVALYFIAAYLKRYVEIEKCKHTIGIYLCASLITVTIELVLNKVSQQFSVLSVLARDMYYSRYNSLFVVIASVALFISFAKLDIRNITIQKMIKFVSPLTFGVYLIHDNPNVRLYIWNTVFKMEYLDLNFMLFVKMIIIALMIFVLCIAFDYIRHLLFMMFEKTSFYRKTVLEFENKFGKLFYLEY